MKKSTFAMLAVAMALSADVWAHEMPKEIQFDIPPGWHELSGKTKAERGELIVYKYVKNNAIVTIQIFSINEKSPLNSMEEITSDFKKQQASIAGVWSSPKNYIDDTDFVYAYSWENFSEKSKGKVHIIPLKLYPDFYAVVIGYWSERDNSTRTVDFIKFVYNVQLAYEEGCPCSQPRPSP